MNQLKLAKHAALNQSPTKEWGIYVSNNNGVWIGWIDLMAFLLQLYLMNQLKLSKHILNNQLTILKPNYTGWPNVNYQITHWKYSLEVLKPNYELPNQITVR
jgi:hypothetical protein